MNLNFHSLRWLEHLPGHGHVLLVIIMMTMMMNMVNVDSPKPVLEDKSGIPFWPIQHGKTNTETRTKTKTNTDVHFGNLWVPSSNMSRLVRGVGVLSLNLAIKMIHITLFTISFSNIQGIFQIFIAMLQYIALGDQLNYLVNSLLWIALNCAVLCAST